MPYFHLSFQNHQYMILPTKDFSFSRAAFQKSWKPANLLAKKKISPAFVSMSDYGIWVNFTGFKISWKAGGLKSPRPEKLV